VFFLASLALSNFLSAGQTPTVKTGTFRRSEAAHFLLGLFDAERVWIGFAALFLEVGGVLGVFFLAEGDLFVDLGVSGAAGFGDVDRPLVGLGLVGVVDFFVVLTDFFVDGGGVLSPGGGLLVSLFSFRRRLIRSPFLFLPKPPFGCRFAGEKTIPISQATKSVTTGRTTASTNGFVITSSIVYFALRSGSRGAEWGSATTANPTREGEEKGAGRGEGNARCNT